MDPNETLARIRELVRRMLERGEGVDTEQDVIEGVEIAEKFQALDKWIDREGLLPRDWIPR